MPALGSRPHHALVCLLLAACGASESPAPFSATLLPANAVRVDVTPAADAWTAELAGQHLRSEIWAPVGRAVILDFRSAAPRTFRVPAVRIECDLAAAPTSVWFQATKTGVFPIELVDAEGIVRGTGELHAIPAEEFTARFPGTDRSK
jgi:hypothetical protein